MLKKRSFISIVYSVVIVGLVYLVVLLTPEPPVAKVELARQTLAEARNEGAGIYAPDLFLNSEKAYKAALVFWEKENNVFILFREYDRTDSCCNVAIEQAHKAINRAKINSRNLHESLGARLVELQSETDKYSDVMNFFPVDKRSRQDFLKGKMLFTEAAGDHSRNELIACAAKLDKAEHLIQSATVTLNKMLVAYFKNYPTWTSLYQASLKNSKSNHNYLIVIDKMARKCELYKNGKHKKSYNIELGRNWIGDKSHQGDQTTPEGAYRIVRKLDTKQSKYFRALLINYPNEEDIQRFKEAKKNGSLPATTDIGGAIEIHGHGGKGVDWTDGCIALKDEEMKELFDFVPVSTPVIIVGSLVPLHEILNQ